MRKLIIIVFYFISEFNGYKLFCLYGYIIYLYIEIIMVRKKINYMLIGIFLYMLEFNLWEKNFCFGFFLCKDL